MLVPDENVTASAVTLLPTLAVDVPLKASVLPVICEPLNVWLPPKVSSAPVPSKSPVCTPVPVRTNLPLCTSTVPVLLNPLLTAVNALFVTLKVPALLNVPLPLMLSVLASVELKVAPVSLL